MMTCSGYLVFLVRVRIRVPLFSRQQSHNCRSGQHFNEMPYVLISTQIRLECGPTVVGDEYSDLELMQYLGAISVKALGNNFIEYRTNDPPRLVLDKLEKRGYRVLTATGIGSTIVWTLHKEDGPNKLSTDDSMGIRNTV